MLYLLLTNNTFQVLLKHVYTLTLFRFLFFLLIIAEMHFDWGEYFLA